LHRNIQQTKGEVVIGGDCDMLEMQVLILLENLIEITILIRIEMTIYL